MRHATAGLLFVLLTLGLVSGQEIRHEDLAQSKTAQASKATPRRRSRAYQTGRYGAKLLSQPDRQ